MLLTRASACRCRLLTPSAPFDGDVPASRLANGNEPLVVHQLYRCIPTDVALSPGRRCVFAADVAPLQPVLSVLLAGSCSACSCYSACSFLLEALASWTWCCSWRRGAGCGAAAVQLQDADQYRSFGADRLPLDGRGAHSRPAPSRQSGSPLGRQAAGFPHADSGQWIASANSTESHAEKCRKWSPDDMPPLSRAWRNRGPFRTGREANRGGRENPCDSGGHGAPVAVEGLTDRVQEYLTVIGFGW
jgi:hypothetical protein